MKTVNWLLLFITCSFCIPAFGQNWSNAGMPFNSSQVRDITIDTVNNKMYVVGAIVLDGTTDYSKNTVCVYDNGNWSHIDTVNNLIFSSEIYNGDLYIGGGFLTVNSTPMPSIAKWNGSSWVGIGGLSTDGPVYSFREINDELYVMGAFTQIGGISANGIAKWDGTSWSNVNNFPSCGSSSCLIFDCIEYKGNLYVSGNFETVTGLSDIAVYKSGAWQRVGGSADSLRGSFCDINKLAIYNNELYAGGMFFYWEGNVGNCIVKWNDTSWQPVGTGLQGINNSINMDFCRVWDMKTYKGKLYVSGSFSFAGNAPAPRMAMWDGAKWCGVDRNMDNSVIAFSFYNDTLFVGSADSIESTFVNGCGKFHEDYTYIDTCSIDFTSVSENYPYADISVYPNPSNGEFSFSGLEGENVISIYDMTGKLISKNEKVKNSNFKVDLSGKAKGIYLFRIEKEGKLIKTGKLSLE